MIRVGVGEEQVDLAAVGLGGDGIQLGAQLGGHPLVGLGVEQAGEVAGVGGAALDPLPAADLLAETGGLLVQRPGLAGVVPDRRVGDLPLQVGEPGTACVEVKGAP